MPQENLQCQSRVPMAAATKRATSPDIKPHRPYPRNHRYAREARLHALLRAAPSGMNDPTGIPAPPPVALDSRKPLLVRRGLRPARRGSNIQLVETEGN